MSVYLAREWEVRALLAGRMKRVVVPKPVDPRAGELLVKETWANIARDGHEPIWGYKENGAEYYGVTWRSAANMPAAAIRIRRPIAQVTAKRFADFTRDDALGCGLGVITKDGSLFKHGIPDRDGLPGTDNTGWPWDEWQVDPRDALRRVLTERYKKIDWVWVVELDGQAG